jgi:hypothetical protein
VFCRRSREPSAPPLPSLPVHPFAFAVRHVSQACTFGDVVMDAVVHGFFKPVVLPRLVDGNPARARSAATYTHGLLAFLDREGCVQLLGVLLELLLAGSGPSDAEPGRVSCGSVGGGAGGSPGCVVGGVCDSPSATSGPDGGDGAVLPPGSTPNVMACLFAHVDTGVEGVATACASLLVSVKGGAALLHSVCMCASFAPLVGSLRESGRECACFRQRCACLMCAACCRVCPARVMAQMELLSLKSIPPDVVFNRLVVEPLLPASAAVLRQEWPGMGAQAPVMAAVPQISLRTDAAVGTLSVSAGGADAISALGA